MDPLFDRVSDRTQDLRRTADAARRERELRGSPTDAQDRKSYAAATQEAGAARGVPAETASAT